MIYLLDLFGTFVFALSGALAGTRKKMDIYGIIVLACVTAVGGGTLRDTLLGRTPPFIFHDYNYMFLSIFAAILVFFYHKHINKVYNALLVMDAIGLAVFTVIGIVIGLKSDIGYFGAVLVGIMTATAGGMIRDVLQGEIPLVLQRTVYASACLAGGILFTILSILHLNEDINMIISAILVFIIRMMAIKKNWNLPMAK
jgi:uncharacterized membrane protein YeiH